VPRNFTNCAAEFGKICCRETGALMMTMIACVFICITVVWMTGRAFGSTSGKGSVKQKCVHVCFALITCNILSISFQLHCCGVDNYTDWLDTKWHASHENESYPASCCFNKTCIGNYTHGNATDLDPNLYSEVCLHFYCVMHVRSAKRDVAIVSRPSICLPVDMPWSYRMG